MSAVTRKESDVNLPHQESRAYWVSHARTPISMIELIREVCWHAGVETVRNVIQQEKMVSWTFEKVAVAVESGAAQICRACYHDQSKMFYPCGFSMCSFNLSCYPYGLTSSHCSCLAWWQRRMKNVFCLTLDSLPGVAEDFLCSYSSATKGCHLLSLSHLGTEKVGYRRRCIHHPCQSSSLLE